MSELILWYSSALSQIGRIQARLAATSQPSGFTCPRCGMTSPQREDIAEGYCGNCHDWTGNDAGSRIRDLIGQSSLGTPEAKALRDSADPDLVRQILQRSRELETGKSEQQ